MMNFFDQHAYVMSSYRISLIEFVFLGERIHL